LEEAEAKLRRFRDAIAAGVDPTALVESINEAQADRTAAQGALAAAGEPAGITDAEVYAMIDSLGDIGPRSPTASRASWHGSTGI